MWTADSSGQFHTGDLSAEWKADYATMLAGQGNTLTALQRLEGNAEAVLENTAAKTLSTGRQQAFREDAQREYDAIWAAMQRNQVTYGIDPNAMFSAFSYLKMEETLQSDETLKELAIQGHGLNSPPLTRYDGFTTEFQNTTDNKTFFVGGGPGSGELAIPSFFDDDVLTHAPFPVASHNGVLTQVNQNGTLEDALSSDVLTAANEFAFTRVLVASDFSTDKTATGAVSLVPGPAAAAAAPVAGAGQMLTLDGGVIPTAISGITAHSWTADATGLFHTANLAAEWKADYAIMLAGHADTLTPLQRMEGNAEAVLENTAAAKLNATQQQSFREDAQREFDAIDGAMRIDQVSDGIDPTRPFNIHTFETMEETLQQTPLLEELALQGHGMNSPPAKKYSGFTNDFQNRTDNTTYFIGGGPGSAELAIPTFFDDDILTHAPFASVMHNGTLDQLNQNGNIENQVATDQMVAANAAFYQRVYVASDFSLDPTAIGDVVVVPNVQAAPVLPTASTLASTVPGAIVGFADQTSEQSGAVTMSAVDASGPSYLTSEYIYGGSDSIALSTEVANTFLHSGSGNDALQVTSGQNVLDGGVGSNFLTGGSGMDTFFTDARGAGVVWNTIRNFHAGDAATLWGFVPGVSSYRWDATTSGAAGSEGATLRANIVGGAGRSGDGTDASITFAGLSVDQAQKLQFASGTQAAGSYLYIYNPGV